jgi:hypothetical protein
MAHSIVRLSKIQRLFLYFSSLTLLIFAVSKVKSSHPGPHAATIAITQFGSPKFSPEVCRLFPPTPYTCPRWKQSSRPETSDYRSLIFFLDSVLFHRMGEK